MNIILKAGEFAGFFYKPLFSFKFSKYNPQLIYRIIVIT